LLGTLFVTISNIFAIYPAEILRQGIDLVSQGTSVYELFKGSGSAAVLKEHFEIFLFYFGVIVIAAALLKGIFMFFMRQTIIVMSRLIEYDLKNDIFSHYQKLDLAFYKRNKTGDLMARISEDVSQVRMYLGPAIMYAISTVSLFLLVLGRMLSIDVKLTLFVMAPLPLMAFLVYKVNSLVISRSEAVQRQLSNLSSMTQEAFSGIRVTKAYNRDASMLSRFREATSLFKKLNMRMVKINAWFIPVILLMIGLSTLLTVYIGGLGVYAGEVSTGTIAEFILYVGMLTWPVASMGWVTSIVQRAAASQTRINEFLQSQPEIRNENLQAEAIRGDIEFRNLSFVYPDSGIKALDQVSFRVEAGQSLAIVGRTGSGKSTIAALIARLYEASEGSVLIDGRPIQQINLNSLRADIGYVPQEVFLFSETIGNNIAFGLSRPDESAIHEKVERSARDAVIYDNIMDLPQGFETRVGERGITLSGGQKQRICIARAIIREPAILLFDDCLSAVDTETEEKILLNLRRIMQGRTSIIISHRISSVKHCDQIIVLDHGRIVEQGTHQELLDLGGEYAGIYQKQLLEELKPEPESDEKGRR